MNGDVTKFVDQLAGNHAFRQEFTERAQQNEGGLAGVAVAMGAARGLQFDPSDCRAYAEDLHRRMDEDGSLSDAELENGDMQTAYRDARRCYRKLARRYLPDNGAGASARTAQAASIAITP